MSVDMKLISVPADGDCLYHAFIRGLITDGHFSSISPSQLRAYVADKILQESDLYDDLVREWVDFNVISDVNLISPPLASNRIRNSKEWATSTVIHILSLGFHVRVVVFQTISGRFYSEVFPSEWKRPEGTKLKHKPFKTIYMLRRGYHFDLLEPLEDERVTAASGDFVNSQDGQDFHERRQTPYLGGGGGGIDAYQFYSSSDWGLSSHTLIGVLIIITMLFTV